MITEFDPTKKQNLPEGMKRPLGQIVIQWDPNTQRLGFNIQGLIPVEEIGLLQWMINLRMKEHLAANDNKQVMVVPAGSVPNVKGN